MNNSPLLRICNIQKLYGKTHALKGIFLDLYPGEVVSLLGINGAGKTTLSAIIATLHPPTSGSIYFEGHSIYDDLPSYRQHIGYCPQKPNLNNLLKVKDNLYLAGKYYGLSDNHMQLRLDELDRELGIYEYINYYPTELSGGWKQRIMIARTLIHSPKLVILDEPTVALDPDVRHQLWQYITHIRSQGITILLTTHYLEEAEKLSDRICLLNQGEVRIIDTPKNLMQTFKKDNLEGVFLQLIKKDSSGTL